MVSPAPSLPKSFAQLSPAEAAELLAARKLPPVESWHPARTGDSAMEIRADGSWYHEGGRINRPAMVKLFSTILRREPDGGHVLVTPAEKLAIAVEDTAFRAVEMKSEGEGAFGGAFDRGEGQLLWGHAIGPYFDLQTGLRQDVGPGPSPTYAVLGVEGLAPYWFDVEAALFLSDKGDVTTRIEGSYDQRITQRLTYRAPLVP